MCCAKIFVVNASLVYDLTLTEQRSHTLGVSLRVFLNFLKNASEWLLILVGVLVMNI